MNTKVGNAIKLQKILKFIHQNKSAYLHSKVKFIQTESGIIGYSYDINNDCSQEINNVVPIMRRECFKCCYDNVVSEIDLKIFNALTNIQNFIDRQSGHTLNRTELISVDAIDDLQPAQLWSFFINNFHGLFHGLTPENLAPQNINKINIQGKTFKELANIALKTLGLDENITIFDDDGGLNKVVCDKIKEHPKKKINAIQLLQKQAIRLNAERSDYRGSAPTLKENGGEILGYRINRRFIKCDSIKPITSNIGMHEGASKILTHKTHDSNYANSELKNPNIIGLTLKNSSNFDCINPSILVVIKANHLNCFVIQYRINENMLISQNVGDDMYDLVFYKQTYIFNIKHFAKLATQLDTLHELHLVHRDLKLNNMGIIKDSITNEENIVVFDNDTMVKIGEVLSNAGTAYYTPAEKFLTKDVMDDLGSQINRDKYNFLVSIIITCHKELIHCDLNNVQIPDYIIEKFIKNNIKPEHKQSVHNFLRFTHKSNDEIRAELGLAADIDYYKKIDAIPPLAEILNITT